MFLSDFGKIESELLDRRLFEGGNQLASVVAKNEGQETTVQHDCEW